MNELRLWNQILSKMHKILERKRDFNECGLAKSEKKNQPPPLHHLSSLFIYFPPALSKIVHLKSKQAKKDSYSLCGPLKGNMYCRLGYQSFKLAEGTKHTLCQCLTAQVKFTRNHLSLLLPYSILYKTIFFFFLGIWQHFSRTSFEVNGVK